MRLQSEEFEQLQKPAKIDFLHIKLFPQLGRKISVIGIRSIPIL